MKNLKILLFFLITLSFIVLFQNCAKVAFSKRAIASSGVVNDNGGPGPGNTPGKNCHVVFDQVQTSIELMFVVDASSSNKSTDPDKSVRMNSIDQFYQAYKNKSNFSWDVISFAGTTATIRAQSSAAVSVENFISWLAGYKHDVHGTPYQAALDETASMITQDANRSADKKYVVVFLSDGKPSGSKSDSYWDGEVAKIAALVPNRVSFSTIYYGPNDAGASGLLEGMAQAGQGNFLDTNKDGKIFSIADLAVVPGEVCD